MADQSLNLAHLSDIHFRRRRANGTYTLDEDIRGEMADDLLKIGKELGGIHGLLITGDVAYSGQESEYATISVWLTELCRKLGCPEQYVWMVAGNHDVDRSELRSGLLLAARENVRRSFTTGGSNGADATLGGLLEDQAAPDLLYKPIKPYNSFAAKFGCHFDSQQPYWQQDVKLNDGSILRMRGLNTTLLSHQSDDDGANKLILGISSCALRREEGVEYLVLCHHPPRWLLDERDVSAYLDGRARIQLFGHEHDQRVLPIENKSVRVFTGALNPDPKEGHYEPRYNVLTLRVAGAGEERVLHVGLFAQRWDHAEKEFRMAPLRDKDRSLHLEFPLAPWTPAASANQHLGTGVTATMEPFQVTAELLPTENRKNENPVNAPRRLAYRFLALPYHLRIEAAQSLGLLRDEDKDVQDAELFRRFFQRAAEMKRLDELWREVEQRHSDGNPVDNPFNRLQY